MLRMDVDEASNLIELTVDGPISRDSFTAALARLEALATSPHKLNVIEVVHDIGWIPPDLWWKDVMFNLHHHDWLNRVAVVSDKGWIGPLTRLFAPIYPASIRVFRESELEQARRWARDGDDDELPEAPPEADPVEMLVQCDFA